MDTTTQDFQEEISNVVWENKYRYQFSGKIYDQTLADTFHRVAKTAAQAEKKSQRNYWEQQFLTILKDFHFIPGGRILAGAGTQHRITLLNCFVMKIAKDSMKAIFQALEEAAFTLQQGGGVGFNFSVLRPTGQIAGRTGSIASGPVSFMRIWDTMSATMQSTGARRGAMMGTLRCDHPDIETFIEAKKDPHEFRHFNLSILVTNEFMKAVKNDKPWPLVFPVRIKKTSRDEIIYKQWTGASEKIPCKIYRYVSAKKLWNKIIKSAYEFAEPGVIFQDTINDLNNLWYRENISATNPCGEIPLPDYGACDLGSINLTQFIQNPFTEKAKLNWKAIKETVAIATRFLDNVIDISKYPLKQQKKEALSTRRIGLGITGLGDAFVMLGVRYGNTESIKLASRIMRTIAHATWEASIALAKEKGPFPAFVAKKYCESKFVLKLSNQLQKDIKRYGIRNSHHNTIAPTGTTSLLANNISNGIEPIFATKYKRNIRLRKGELQTYIVNDYAYQCWKKHGKSKTPPAWVDAQHLLPEDHLMIQSAMQKYVDNSISKTIYIPKKFPFRKLEALYTKAFKLGLKGCTIYRPNPITGSVITTQSVQETGSHCAICEA